MKEEILEVTELTEEEARIAKETLEKNAKPKVTFYEPTENLTNEADKIITNEKEAKGFINNCISYVKSGGFAQKVKSISKETGIPEKKIARNFIQKVLGAVGDGTEVAGSTVEELAKTFLSILHYILRKAVEIIVKIAKFIFRLLTFNYTNKPQQTQCNTI